MSLHRNSSLVSLLDVFSCGFGAAILLGFIFSVSRDDSEPPTYKEDFAVIEARSSDPKALLQFVVIPPGDGPPIIVDPSLETNRGREVTVEPEGLPIPLSYLAYGGSRQPEGGLKPTVEETGAVNDVASRYYLLYVTSTLSGRWRLGVRYHDRAGTELDRPGRRIALARPVAVDLELSWLGGNDEDMAGCSPAELYLGETALCDVDFTEEDP